MEIQMESGRAEINKRYRNISKGVFEKTDLIIILLFIDMWVKRDKSTNTLKCFIYQLLSGTHF